MKHTLSDEKEVIKVVPGEDADDAIEAMIKAHPEEKGWKYREPRIENAPGNKVKITMNFEKIN